jgi:hypothetical protein
VSLDLDYLDEGGVADRFATVAHKVCATVTIDGDLSSSWPPLPCRRLWT